MPLILAFRRQREEDRKFEARLGYLVRPCFKIQALGMYLSGRVLAYYIFVTSTTKKIKTK
jgi:hypothetical protein